MIKKHLGFPLRGPMVAADRTEQEVHPVTAARPITRPHFTRPRRQVVSMLIVLSLVGLGSVMAAPRVMPVFTANPGLNGFIFGVFVIGVASCFWQVWQLHRSVRWIESFTGGADTGERGAPQLLAPLAALLRGRHEALQLSATASRSILDSVGTRIEEDREITRYIVNTLIFLGLLGTFYGLATTVPALVDTIRSLAPEEGEAGIEVFNRLMSGLDRQLSGMGVAFASSLLGLAGSLVVGLLELFASHGQNRFYRELEEWLSSVTRVGLASGEDGASDQEVLEAILTQLSEQMDSMQAMFSEATASRAAADDSHAALAEAVRGLSSRMDTGDLTAALARVAEGQDGMIAAMKEAGMEGGLDAESRMRLRSIDVQMLRLLEEMAAGREETMAELRGEIGAMTRALRPPRHEG